MTAGSHTDAHTPHSDRSIHADATPPNGSDAHARRHASRHARPGPPARTSGSTSAERQWDAAVVAGDATRLLALLGSGYRLQERPVFGGCTGLGAAAVLGNTAAVDVLIAAGANIDRCGSGSCNMQLVHFA